MPAHDFTASPTLTGHPGAYCIHCGRTRDDHQSVGPSVPEQSFGGGAEPADVVAHERMVECRACDGRGSHSRKRSMTSDPTASSDLETFDCGLCRGTGRTTLAEARRWDERRSA